MSNRPIAIDLFAGCGGMSLGLEAAGFDIAASVDIDPIHTLVHHYNFPYGVTLCQDIGSLSSQDLSFAIRDRGFTGEIDLVAGGPPCQGFSYIGKRQLSDPRNKLVFEYVRIVLGLQPKYFIFENVPGIIAGKHQEFLQELIREFEQNNYRVVKPVRVLDASHYGAPQKRKRLILIGYRKDMPKIQYPVHTNGLTPDLKPLTTVDAAIGDLSDIPVFIGKDFGVDAEKLDYSDFRISLATKPQAVYSLCHRRSINPLVWGHLGSNHTENSIQRFARTNPGKIETISRFLRLSPNSLSNTLRAGTPKEKGAYTAPRPIHYQLPRCISIREAARLHTFPDWFQFHRTIWHGFREIGNAVIPLFAKSLGTEIIKSLEIDLTSISLRELPALDNSILSYKTKQASKFWERSLSTSNKDSLDQTQ